MSNSFENTIAEMQDKLARISRNKEKIARIIIREGFMNAEDYSEEQLEQFAKSLCIADVSFNTCADGVEGVFSVTDEMEYLGGVLSISILPDNSIELEGWSY